LIGGYTRLGYALHSRHSQALPSMSGQVVLVTGATSGIGYAAATGFARLGASVWLLARDRARGERAAAEIARETGNAAVDVGLCDLSEKRSVRRFAERFAAGTARLDVLVNNAGVLTPERRLSDDGLELTLATNVVGPFLLTRLLMPALKRSAPARVINVSSGGMYTQRIDVDDLQSARGRFRGAAAYARAKRAEVILSELGAERLEDSGVVINAMHPGWVETPGLEQSLPGFRRLLGPLLRTPEQGTDTILWLAAAPEAGCVSGGFWNDRRRVPTHLLPGTRETAEERARLWAEVERLAGV
jgi:dehydrogenase/reductase SDR family member 12